MQVCGIGVGVGRQGHRRAHTSLVRKAGRSVGSGSEVTRLAICRRAFEGRSPSSGL